MLLDLCLKCAIERKNLLIARKIRKEIKYRQGQQDRIDGKGALSADGCYLNGYYADDLFGFYYVTSKELFEISH